MPTENPAKPFVHKRKNDNQNAHIVEPFAYTESHNHCLPTVSEPLALHLAPAPVSDAESECRQTSDEGRGLQYGNRVLAERLMRARLAAGFRSAKAAATEHGWNVHTYKGLEVAQRPLTPERCAAHAEAFRVPVQWLADESARLVVPEGLQPADRRRLLIMEAVPLHGILPAVQELTGGRPWDGQDARLRTARIMAGLTSASKAAAYLTIPRTSYACHENGQNRLTPLSARLYAQAFSVEFEWLFRGNGTSGLPTSDNWPEGRWAGDLDDLTGAPRPAPSRLAAPEQIADSVSLLQLRPLWLAVSDTMSAIPQIGFAASGGFEILTHWTLPRQAVGRIVEDDDAMLVVVELHSEGGSPESGNDPVLVDVGDRSGDAGRLLVSGRDGRFWIHDATADFPYETRLGAVKGKLLSKC